MRALFQRSETQMAAGGYVLVAKAETVDIPFEVLEKAFVKMLGQVGALQS